MKYPLILLSFLTCIAIAAEPSAKDCDAYSDTLSVTRCLDHLAQERASAVEQLYETALMDQPEGALDRRSNRMMLVKEHAAWKTYMKEHCAYVAGAMEGASSWISQSQARCELRELDARIRFLQARPANNERVR